MSNISDEKLAGLKKILQVIYVCLAMTITMMSGRCGMR